MVTFEDNELELAIVTYNRIPEVANYRHNVFTAVYCELFCNHSYDKK